MRGRDSDGNTGTRAYTVNIGTNSLTVSPPTLSNGTVGSAYSETVSASGGTGPYTFARTAGALPAGLSLDSSSGDITGSRYDPGSDTWLGTTSLNVPQGRWGQTAVWTGSRMIVWGGVDQDSHALQSGGRYDPLTDNDSWSSTSMTAAPTAGGIRNPTPASTPAASGRPIAL